jgi:hypothetical protein
MEKTALWDESVFLITVQMEKPIYLIGSAVIMSVHLKTVGKLGSIDLSRQIPH